MPRERFDFVVRLRDRFSTGIRSLRRSVGGLLTDLGKITGVSAAVTGALGALSGLQVFRAGLSSAIDFEEQLSVVQSVSGATREEFEALSAEANSLGASTRFTATEAAQGLEELVRAGQNAGEAIGTIGAALNTAQANQIAVADAATIVTTTLNQFGKGASEAANVADLLTRGTQLSAQNINNLTVALRSAGPQAALVGLELEETIGVIGRLADVGLRGEIGGTALRNALIELNTPTSKFREELAGLGITSTNFLDVLSELAARGDGAQRALDALGKQAGPAISTLVSSGTEDLNALIASLREAGGTAAATAADMDNNLRGALLGLGSAFDAFARGAAQPLLEPLSDAVRQLSDRLRSLASSPSFQRAADKFSQLVDDGIKGFISFIDQINFDEALDKVTGFVTAARERIAEFSVDVGDAGKAVGTVTAVMSAGFNTVRATIELAFGVLVRFVQGLSQVTQNVLEFANVFGVLDERIRASAAATQLLSDIGTAAFDAAAESGGKVVDAVDSIGDRSEAAGEKVKTLEENLTDAGDAGEEAADGLEAAGDAAEEAAAKTDELAESSKDAEQAAIALAEAQEKAAGAARAEQYDRLISRLGKLQAAGAGASDESIRLQGELQRLIIEQDKAAESTGNLGTAFQQLGVRSGTELRNAANQAETAFNQIVQAARRGEASQEDVNRAFAGLVDVYQNLGDGADEFAQRQIEAQLRVIAGSNGVTEGLDAIGFAGEEAGDRAAGGLDQIANAANRAKQNTNDISENIRNVAEASEQAGGNAAAAIGGIITSFTSLGASVTDEVNRILEKITVPGQAVGDFLRKLGSELQTLQGQLRENQERADEALANFNAGADETGSTLRSLRSDFALLDDARLDSLDQAIAQADQRLEQFRDTLRAANAEAQAELGRTTGTIVDQELTKTEQRIQEINQLLRDTLDPESRGLLIDELRTQQAIALEREKVADAEQKINEARKESARIAERVNAKPAQIVVTLQDSTDPDARRLRLADEDKEQLIGEVVDRLGAARGFNNGG